MARIKRGKWIDNKTPQSDWVCARMEDMGIDRIKCEMCEFKFVRYIHHMKHTKPKMTLRVGTRCAGHMENNYGEACERKYELEKASTSNGIINDPLAGRRDTGIVVTSTYAHNQRSRHTAPWSLSPWFRGALSRTEVLRQEECDGTYAAAASTGRQADLERASQWETVGPAPSRRERHGRLLSLAGEWAPRG